MNHSKAIAILSILLSMAACGSQPAAETAPGSTADVGPWTDTNFPSYIRQVTHFGQRADWSHDGKRILFLEKTYGDAFELDLETGIIRGITLHYHHNGYTRALYLNNGDILLSGSRTFDPEDHSDARRKTAEMWVLSKSLDKPPVPLGEFCSEGPAVSRTSPRIAWAADHDNYPDALPEDVSQMYVATIDYSSGGPKLVDKKVILDNRETDFDAEFETQNFIPGDETKLTFAAYGFQRGEAMLLDTETGKVTRLTDDDVRYDEPEGAVPGGKWTLVESDHQHRGEGSTHIDIWKVALDGSDDRERITYFNEEGVFKGTNPVVSDDGRFMAFQVPRVAQIAGVGSGIYVMDLAAAGH